jgi:uncharacterized protein (DUF488 family)
VERTIYTIGHSTRTIEAFIQLLREHAIELLVDVRRYPGSRRNPQFGSAALAAALHAVGIEYRHEIDLGGRRAPPKSSPDTAWRNVSFRGYAAHARSDEFAAALERVLEQAERGSTAIMCAEAHPSQCHRRIISDVLVARGWNVVHVLDRGRSEPHLLDENARVGADGKLVYSADRQRGFEFGE